MDLKLEGKRALVCGSSQGIGWASARELAQLGCSVTLLSRDQRRLSDLLAELPSGVEHHTIACDVTHHDELCEKVSAQIKNAGSFDILINNSGGPPGGPITDAAPAAFTAALSQHLYPAIVLMQLLLPDMKKKKFGRIVNIVSTSVKAPLKGLGVSNTTRGAVASWAKTLAAEVAADGITVNCVLPGATDTQRLAQIITAKAEKAGISTDQVRDSMLAEIPAARFGLPHEVAAAVAFLCSPSAAYINGVALPVDGGRTPCL